MRNSKDQKPNAEKRSSRLAEIDEIWARHGLPSLVQQQQRHTALKFKHTRDVLSEHASTKDLD